MVVSQGWPLPCLPCLPCLCVSVSRNAIRHQRPHLRLARVAQGSATCRDAPRTPRSRRAPTRSPTPGSAPAETGVTRSRDPLALGRGGPATKQSRGSSDKRLPCRPTCAATPTLRRAQRPPRGSQRAGARCQGTRRAATTRHHGAQPFKAQPPKARTGIGSLAGSDSQRH